MPKPGTDPGKPGRSPKAQGYCPLVSFASGLKLPPPVPVVISLAAMKETAVAYHAFPGTSWEIICLKLTVYLLEAYGIVAEVGGGESHGAGVRVAAPVGQNWRLVLIVV
jgi:hypothetical protein